MYLLFLDTETTGLSPTSSQVIEVAGVVADLDETTLEIKIVEGFESLVALRGEMDEKITRITGITESDLAGAPKIFEVQKQWSDFLEKYGDMPIIGHSIGFDLGFLGNESWYLPSGHKIDTLDLAKIIYPDLSAVNLEYLVEQLSLRPSEENISDLKLGNDLVLKSHRALYDTICCLNLMFRALQRVSDFGYEQLFYDKLEIFLGIELNFFSKDLDYHEHMSQPREKDIVGVDGRVIPIGMWDKIELLGQKKVQEELHEFLAFDLDQHYLLILMQIYVINQLKMSTKDSPSSYKIHTKSPKELVFAEIILDKLVLDKTNELPKELIPIETFIPNLRMASEKSYRFGRFVTLVEIFLDNCSDLEQIQKNTLSKLISAYDFLLLGLQPLYQRGEFNYNYSTLEPAEIVVQRKLVDIEEILTYIRSTTLKTSNIVNDLIAKNVQKALEQFWEDNTLQINPKNRLTFRYFKNQLFVNKSIGYFSLRKHLELLLKKYPDIKLTTYLDPEVLAEFLQLTECQSIVATEQIEHINLNQNYINFVEEDTEFSGFVSQRIQTSNLNNKINLVLGGQNSTIRDSERALTKTHNPKDYLLLGESGSLTKILSKMQNGFAGLVVVKIGDFGYLSKFVNDYQLGEVWIVNPPYFNIHGYWFGMAKRSDNRDQYMKTLKWIYLHYQASMINKITGLNVNYLRSYRT